MLSATELYKWIAGIALAVCAGAAGIYFVGLATSHPNMMRGTMGASLVVTIVFGIAGARHPGPMAQVREAPFVAASITGPAFNSGQQVVGVTGSVHIGDVNFATSVPQAHLRDYRAEWLDLAAKMRDDCRGFRADYQKSNVSGEQWNIKGQNRNMCMAWSRHAGALLIRSPRVSTDLPDDIRNESNDMHRWLNYLKAYYIFESGPVLRADEGYDATGEIICTGTLMELGEQSAKACIDCSTRETRC